MNRQETSRPDDTEERFDPELAALFSDAGDAPLEAEVFIRRVSEDIQRTRHHRLVRQVTGTALALMAGAFAAPFVGAGTFRAVNWLAQNAPTASFAFASPAACVLAALITWRIARRAFH
jgi:hypothetical protein